MALARLSLCAIPPVVEPKGRPFVDGTKWRSGGLSGAGLWEANSSNDYDKWAGSNNSTSSSSSFRSKKQPAPEELAVGRPVGRSADPLARFETIKRRSARRRNGRECEQFAKHEKPPPRSGTRPPVDG